MTLYWLTATGASSARLYWESFNRRDFIQPDLGTRWLLDLSEGYLRHLTTLGSDPLHRHPLLE